MARLWICLVFLGVCSPIGRSLGCQRTTTTTLRPTTKTTLKPTTTTTTTTTTPRPTTRTTTTKTTTSLARNCGVGMAGSNIVGRTNVSHGQFPWMASLRRNGTHMCAGTIINNYWILTTAQCTFDLATTVRVGEHDHRLNDGSEVTHSVTIMVIHGGYEYGMVTDDIAMIKVESPILYNQYVQPICLPKAGDPVPLGVNLTIAGWGVITKGPSRPSRGLPTILRKATVQADHPQFCAFMYRLLNITITPRSMCVPQAYYISGCVSDSGGPIMITKNGVTTQLGIMSYGCATKFPVVYTLVSEYIDWIKEVSAPRPLPDLPYHPDLR